MNAAASVTHTLTLPVGGGPSIAELEDLLYDILATGADPSLPTGTLEAVQAFVHEHARSKKSHAEFLAFFQARALPMRAERLALLALPPLEMRGRAAESPQLTLLAPDDEPQLIAAAAVSGTRNWGLAAAIALALAALGLGAFAWLSLRAELDLARVQNDRTAAELSNVRAEAGTLRSALDRNAAVMQRVEHKSELLLQTMATPLDPERR